MQNTPNEMSALLEQLRRGADPVLREVTAGGTSSLLALWPHNGTAVDLTRLLDDRLAVPRHLAESALLTTSQSFADYANRFKVANSVLYADANPDAPWLRVIIDYHEGSSSDARPQAHWGRHTAVYNFPISDEMKAWKAKAQNGGELMNGEAFAWFLEEREQDISNPPVSWQMMPEADVDRVCSLLNLRDDLAPGATAEDVAAFRDEEEMPREYLTRLQKLNRLRFGTQKQLLTLSREMTLRSETRTAQKFELQGGTRALVFEENQEASIKGARVKVPEIFLIDIPVFEGEERRLMPVRLYYRQKGGQVHWAVKLVDHRRMIREAVTATAKAVAEQTGLPLLSGTHKQ